MVNSRKSEIFQRIRILTLPEIFKKTENHNSGPSRKTENDVTIKGVGYKWAENQNSDRSRNLPENQNSGPSRKTENDVTIKGGRV